MSFTTFSGPIRSGTVRTGAATSMNAGTVVLAQSVTLAGTVAKTTPVAQALFTLPAGAKILRVMVEKTVVLAGNSISQVAMTLGTSGTANKYVTSVNLAVTAGLAAQATVDAGMVSVECDNIGTSDVTLYGTFTATTGDATSGSLVVTVNYLQRSASGSTTPAP